MTKPDPNAKTYRVSCDCGWWGLTRRPELKPHHSCPMCDGDLTHQAASGAHKQEFMDQNKVA